MGSPAQGSDCSGGRAPRQSLAPLYGHIHEYIGGKVRDNHNVLTGSRLIPPQNSEYPVEAAGGSS